VVDRFRRSLPEGTTLACDLAPALPAIDGDESRLIQTITNLLSNSAESLSETGGTIRLTTLHRDANPEEARQVFCAEPPEDGSCVMLEVTDSGVGMSDDVIPKIFDPFYSTKSIGRGLGLAAVLGIVRAHRGVIQVNSRPGKGTSVRAFFPCGRPEKVASAAPSRTPIMAREGCTVLLVDDEDGVREVAGEMLRRLGVEVISATDGAEAIQILTAQGEQISAVLLDVTMPKMTGPETARRLRLLQPETPIILMSGYSQTRLTSRAGDLGVAGFLRKPFLPDALESVLENALSRRAGSSTPLSTRRCRSLSLGRP
jgi:CheY-like chemotaxis protein